MILDFEELARLQGGASGCQLIIINYAFHSLTTSKAYKLRVQMLDSRGRFAEALYDNFELRGDFANKTRITLSSGEFLHLPYGLADDLYRRADFGVWT